MTDAVEQGVIAAASAGGNSAGKGAWDCDNNKEIPPNKEARAQALRAQPRGAMWCLHALLPRLRRNAARGRSARRGLR